jgi:uncharacterized protein YgiM (DUF1202 family)
MLPLAVVACSDEEPAQEPVAGETAPAVPDAPGGDMGEAAAKPGEPGGAPEGAPADMGGAPADTDGGAPMGDTGSTTSAPAGSAAGDVGGGGGGSMVVTAGGLNVRSGPGTKHKSLRVLKKGTKVSVESCSGNWCRIGDGEFVSKKFLSNAM